MKMNRRTALKTMAAGAALGAMPTIARPPADRPNIIFILTDDHRYDAMGFMDKPWLPTPHLDRLAREGVHFVNSFVTTSLCSPSRASFLTGRYAHCHGVTNNLTPWLDRNVTFLELLHRASYDTAFIGKWHMPGKGIPDLKGQGKVDRMVSFSIATGQGIYRNCPLIVDGKKVESQGYITDVLTNYALEFLDRKRARPFCLWLAHKAAHAPFQPPEKYRGSLREMPLHPLEPNFRNFPVGVIQAPQVQSFKKNQPAYYETLRGVDDSAGRVLAFLDEHGLAENTMIVYAGDNGYFWGEHGLIDKRYAYEESVRVPHLLRFPRLAPQGGRKVTAMVLNIDLAPTVLTAAGLPLPREVQGQSWLDLAAGKSRPGRDSFLYEYFPDPGFPIPPIQAVRTPDWKYITYPGAKFPDELYHLSDDPGERRDLALVTEAGAMKKELQAELERLKKTTSR